MNKLHFCFFSGASVDFRRQSLLPCVVDRSALCCLFYIGYSKWKLLHCWQVWRAPTYPQKPTLFFSVLFCSARRGRCGVYNGEKPLSTTVLCAHLSEFPTCPAERVTWCRSYPSLVWGAVLHCPPSFSMWALHHFQCSFVYYCAVYLFCN